MISFGLIDKPVIYMGMATMERFHRAAMEHGWKVSASSWSCHDLLFCGIPVQFSPHLPPDQAVVFPADARIAKHLHSLLYPPIETWQEALMKLSVGPGAYEKTSNVVCYTIKEPIRWSMLIILGSAIAALASTLWVYLQ